MKVENLKSPFYQFGNKGAVWSNETHIAQSGSWTGTTLCGTPMLSSNWSEIEKHPTIGCKECLEKYLEQQGFILTCSIDDVSFDEHNRPFQQTAHGKIMLSKREFEYQVQN